MQDNSSWTLRKANGTTFGPVDLPELRKWAAEGRIIAGNEASKDGRTWRPVEEIPDLEMNWMAHRTDGKVSGPFNIRAIPALLHHGILELDTRLEHTLNGRELTVPDVLEEMGIDLPEGTTEPEEQPEESTETDTLTTQIDALRCQLEEEQLLAGEREKVLQQQVTELQQKLESATADAAPLQKQLAKTEAQLAKLQESHADQAELQQALEEAQLERETAQSECEELSKTAAQLRAQLAKTQEQLDATGNQLDQATEQHALELADARQSASDAVQQATEAKRALDTLTPQLEEATARASQAEQTLAAEQKRIDEQTAKAKAKLHELRDQVIFMRKNNASLQSEVEHLRQRLARLLKISLIGFAAVLVGLTMTAIISSHKSTTTTAPSPDMPDTRLASAESGGDAEANTASTAPLPEPPAAGDLPAEGVDGADVRSPATKPWPRVSGTGITQRANGNELAITFREPVFASLARLGEQGQTDLSQVAKQIKGSLKAFSLVVEGHTDNEPVRGIGGYADNYALGKARAEAARDYLVDTCGLPTDRIRTISVGETNPPFPNDTPENKRRNRTVVLKLLRR
jgi:chemotaxis protein MotB